MLAYEAGRCLRRSCPAEQRPILPTAGWARGPFAPTVEGGSAAAEIGLANGTTALVAFNDLLAIGVLQRLHHLGTDVPGDVSVVGFDDIFGSDFCHPPLTTVAFPAEQAGRTLIDLLLGPRDAQHAPCIVLPAVLRVR